MRPSCIAARSSAYVCGTGCALAVRPPSRSCTGFHQVTGRQAISCPTPFPCRPTSRRRYAGVIGSKEGVTPSSAHRSRTSPIRGMRLQRLLGFRFGGLKPAGVAPRRALSGVYVCSWRPARCARTVSDGTAGRSPCVRAAAAFAEVLSLQTWVSWFRIADSFRALHGTSICVLAYRRITLHRRGSRYTNHHVSYRTRMSASTPIAQSKTAAMSRVLDVVPRGYHRYVAGTVKTTKAEALAQKFHTRYGIGCTPAQRLTRKSKGVSNAVLVMYWPGAAERVEWLLLATEGSGLESESLCDVGESPRLTWLGYELVRHPSRGRAVWTWRRPKGEMADLHALVGFQASQRQYAALTETLERISRQPGFHGVREQSWNLFQEARRRGYDGDLPYLHHVQKLGHGERLRLSP